MPKKGAHDFESGLLRLRQDYLKRLSASIAEFRRYAELLNQGFLPARDAQTLYRVSHNLVGSGLTFGFPEISEDAKRLNKALDAYMGVDLADVENQTLRRSQVQQELQRFDATCRNVIAGATAAVLHGEATNVTADKAGFLVRKKEEAAALSRAFENLGYESVFAHSIEGLENLIRKKAASFWLIYSALHARDISRLEGLKKICGDTPFYIIAPRESFETRLKALRLGASGFSSASEGIPSFARAVDARARGLPATAQPGRVLIVDDDDMLAAFYGHALRGAGMEVAEVHSAEEAMEALRSKPFDMAVIGADMPHCDGAELVAMMRQSTPPLMQPVLLLSASEAAKPLENREACAYLKKPFMPETLIEVVQRHIKNAI